ncbi:MAG: FKBP-type peptidyl-prolyl cis-trans isomerase [Pseudomonadales bacterium]|jgi:FKBP-type peptidyl-prolyl cis-trans isomerase SlyD|tara:strand:- start:39 stop:473 length:435 start_codon:yes stop_codon:yes gene_type:complete
MPTYYKFNYALRNDTGEVVDSSEAAEALFFVEGDGSMIPGLEKAVMGKEVGDEFSVTIGPEDAYGWPQRQLVRTVSRDMIQSDAEEIEAGMIFQIGSGEESQVVKVVSIESDGITIDGNHPLAGITFNFDVHVMEVREATESDM